MKKWMCVLIILCCFMGGLEVYALDVNALSDTGEEEALVTRAGLADAVMDTYEYITQEFSLPMAEQPPFGDISQSPFQMRIVQAHLAGFMNGVGDAVFSPDENITRCQAAAALYRLTQHLNTKYDAIQEKNWVDIADLIEVPDWAIEASVFMVSTNLMLLKENQFCPDDYLSKTELDGITEKIKKRFVVDDDGERIDFQTFLERMSRMK